ncbi:MAG: DNA primase large subunit PriL [Thermoplasmatales archaeon]|nr:MAG: DNA primase large subunit PriL [Thermoplasmatales archaeon]
MRDLLTLAKYPFLDEAKQYITENGPSITDLLEGLLYERARTIGIERLDNALKNGDVGDRSLATKSDLMMEIFSYPLARMISVGVGDIYLMRRYALGEAYHAFKNLLNEQPLFLLEVSEELNINVEFVENKRNIKVFFKDYLRNAPTRYKKWKMVNRDMENGYVHISTRDLARLILESLRRRIEEELATKKSSKAIEKAFSSDIKRFQNMVKKHKKKTEAMPLGKLSIEKLPPCMKDILKAIQAGENVPHMGRFALVSFLNSLQLNTEEILKLFSNAPDYQEERTRYQVDHITGTSSSKSYKSPGCEKMRTYGICPVDKMDDLCREIYHPISYYSAKWRREKKKK